MATERLLIPAPGGWKPHRRKLTKAESVQRLAQRVLNEYARTGHLPGFIRDQISEKLWRDGDLRRSPEAEAKLLDELKRLVQVKDAEAEAGLHNRSRR